MALATNTPSSARSYADCIKSTRDPSLPVPVRFERTKKEPGSKKLVLGKWVDVQPGDEDALARGENT